MARMSREFSLVLLGAGILTAGYFLWPEENLEAKADQQAQQQVAGNNHQGRTHVHGHGMMFLWLHSGGFAGSGGRPAAVANVSRGGFGSFGHASS
jgi:hypothetical protein